MLEIHRYCLVNPGTMGEPEVLKSLLGDDIEPYQTVVHGFKTMRQVRPPEGVWKVIKSAWNDKGHPYPGAWTLVEDADSIARVSGVVFRSREKVKSAIKRLDEWNFHDRSNPKNGWFRYHAFRQGDTVYLTEMLNGTNLVSVSENYTRRPSYQLGVLEMARQAAAFAANIE